MEFINDGSGRIESLERVGVPREGLEERSIGLDGNAMGKRCNPKPIRESWRLLNHSPGNIPRNLRLVPGRSAGVDLGAGLVVERQ